MFFESRTISHINRNLYMPRCQPITYTYKICRKRNPPLEFSFEFPYNGRFLWLIYIKNSSRFMIIGLFSSIIRTSALLAYENCGKGHFICNRSNQIFDKLNCTTRNFIVLITDTNAIKNRLLYGLCLLLCVKMKLKSEWMSPNVRYHFHSPIELLNSVVGKANVQRRFYIAPKKYRNFLS